MKKSIQSFSIFLAFLCMGFGDVVSPLTSQLKSTYDLSDLSAGLVTFMGFIMFGLLSVPLGLLQDRKSKKMVLLLGLTIAFLGLILPVLGHFTSFGLLLGALLLLGTGATMLQVAGNPIMRDVSPEGKYSRNLSFGQFVKGLGTLAGAIIPLVAVNYWGKDWKLLFPVYAVVILVVIVFVAISNIKESKDPASKPATFMSCFGLLSNSYIALMVLGIFLYVGAEVIMFSKTPDYLAHKFNFDLEKLGLVGSLFFALSLLSGRFLGAIILNWLSPKKFLVITAILSLIGTLGMFIAPNQVIGIVFIAVVGFGFANIFPLIFSISIDKMPERANEISGLMVTAIVGGAFVPLLFGLLSDKISLMTGFFVPVLCMAYILIISISSSIKGEKNG